MLKHGFEIASLVLTLVAVGLGLRAALLSWRASTVSSFPDWGVGSSEPVDPERRRMALDAARFGAELQVGDLNQRAIRWTVASVLASALAGLTGVAASLIDWLI